MKKIFLLGGIVLLLIIVLILVKGNVEKRGTVVIDNTLFNVIIADNTGKQALGLAGKKRLAEDEGMVFVFKTPSLEHFWMRGMEIPIDIIWIREGEVIGVTKNVWPEKGVKDVDLKIYESPGQVDHVLEIKAGGATKFGIREGSRVTIAE